MTFGVCYGASTNCSENRGEGSTKACVALLASLAIVGVVGPPQYVQQLLLVVNNIFSHSKAAFTVLQPIISSRYWFKLNGK